MEKHSKNIVNKIKNEEDELAGGKKTYGLSRLKSGR